MVVDAAVRRSLYFSCSLQYLTYCILNAEEINSGKLQPDRWIC
jgi:hypothetical protein